MEDQRWLVCMPTRLTSWAATARRDETGRKSLENEQSPPRVRLKSRREKRPYSHYSGVRLRAFSSHIIQKLLKPRPNMLTTQIEAQMHQIMSDSINSPPVLSALGIKPVHFINRAARS